LVSHRATRVQPSNCTLKRGRPSPSGGAGRQYDLCGLSEVVSGKVRDRHAIPIEKNSGSTRLDSPIRRRRSARGDHRVPWCVLRAWTQLPAG
jgi:hypothetical protein